jgi:hypothetical protein
MVTRFFLSVFLLLSFYSGKSQITTEPALPVANQLVTITFDSSKESKLGYYTGDLYAHTGVKIEGETDWQHVIESWGNNTTQPKLTNKGNGIYELVITPSVVSFYAVPANEKITQMAFVFRSADGNTQTNDLFVNVYEEGLVVEITEPNNIEILEKNVALTISAQASISSDLKLFLDETLLIQNTGSEISVNYSFTESGTFWLIAEAFANEETVRDSMRVFVRDEIINEPKPTSYKKGINYPDDTSAALVLWAPLKEFVMVIGDFNDWTPSKEFQMKKDGDYFWLEIANLEKGKEYVFQYLIDGELKIADPYTEKIADPWNDKYILNEVYPNLIQYPEGETDGIASVLQPGQDDYNWEVTDFQIPGKEKMVIYELLIRDFTEEHTYKAVLEKLDYLEDLNINVLELMPVNEFEGNSSWGYNPSFYFAPDKYYGPKNELKKLIDECHKRGIAVVIDMVLNHSYGQSPFVQMYMDNYTILPENPWYNVTSPNPVYSWGFDFNHQAAVVEELVDSVNSFWMNEYKVDGFRFDFTKGFTNTPGDGWNYDTPRVIILKRMADEIWNRNPDALVILEHLAENNEEMQLANYGMMMWGNLNGSYREAGKGNVSSSDFEWGVYSERGWGKPNLVTYAESHDEERVMVSSLENGYISGDYNIKELPTALDRIELNSVFHIPLPGPKMIWQFGERGYDISINDFGGRLGEKPPHWEYLENTDRTDLFQVMAKLNELKQTYEEFATDNFDYDLTGAVKWYKLTSGDKHVFTVGNFGIVQTNANVTFPETGIWHEFFSRDSIEINSVSQIITLKAGEYRMYSTRKFDEPHVVTEIDDISTQSDIRVYPNPATNEINISAQEAITNINIYSLTGKLMFQSKSISERLAKVNIEGLSSGIYLVQIFQDKKYSAKRIVVK